MSCKHRDQAEVKYQLGINIYIFLEKDLSSLKVNGKQRASGLVFELWLRKFVAIVRRCYAHWASSHIDRECILP